MFVVTYEINEMVTSRLFSYSYNERHLKTYYFQSAYLAP